MSAFCPPTQYMSLIARLMEPKWDPCGADRTQWAPCWPHELCYLRWPNTNCCIVVIQTCKISHSTCRTLHSRLLTITRHYNHSYAISCLWSPIVTFSVMGLKIWHFTRLAHWKSKSTNAGKLRSLGYYTVMLWLEDIYAMSTLTISQLYILGWL